jgi:Ca2+-binding RTX toxin-like protein
LSAGTDNGDGSYSLTAADLSGLTIAGAAEGSYTLDVTITATDSAILSHSDCNDTSDDTSPTSGTIALVVNGASGPGSDGDPPSGLHFDASLGNIDTGKWLNQDTGLGQFTGSSEGGISWSIDSIASNNAGEDASGFFVIDSSGALSVGSENVGAGIYTLTVTAADADGPSTTSLIIAIGTTGEDTLLLGSATAQVLAFALAGDDQATTGSNDDVILGGSGDDILIGGLGADVILGGAGKDVITGGGGADTLDGGTGGDTFVFLSGNDSLAGSADTILNFDSQSSIDLEALHIGSSAITFTPDGFGVTTISIDLDGIPGAEMEIYVHGTVTLGDLHL